MCAYMLSMQQQQAFNYEIYQGLNKSCNYIGCPLNFYEDATPLFEDTWGAATAAQRKVTFEGVSVAATAAHKKIEKEASHVSYKDSKKFPNKRKCFDLERETCSKHNSISDITTPPKRNKLTIKPIIPGCYVCVEE